MNSENQPENKSISKIVSENDKQSENYKTSRIKSLNYGDMCLRRQVVVARQGFAMEGMLMLTPEYQMVSCE